MCCCCCWPRTTFWNSKASLRVHAFGNHHQLQKRFRFCIKSGFGGMSNYWKKWSHILKSGGHTDGIGGSIANHPSFLPSFLSSGSWAPCLLHLGLICDLIFLDFGVDLAEFSLHGNKIWSLTKERHARGCMFKKSHLLKRGVYRYIPIPSPKKSRFDPIRLWGCASANPIRVLPL